MKFIKLDLLTLLIGLFLFSACENPNSVGLDIDSANAIQGKLVDSITVSTRTQTDDVSSTFNLARYPLGFLKDPTLGNTEASLALSVDLPSEGYSFGTLPVLDSAVLVLNYAGQFYGDTTNSVYAIEVFQLNDDLTKEENFLSNRNWAKGNVILGSKTGKIFPKTFYKVNEIVVGKPDTLKRVTPQIRIRLDNNFIKTNVLDLNSNILKYNDNFTRYFRGLHVSINKTTSTGVGGIMFFDFGGNSSKLDLYFKKQNTTNNTVDTVAVSLPIINKAANGIKSMAVTIKRDYSNAPEITTQLNQPNTQFSKTFVQGLAGLRTKVSFPHLKKFATNAGKLAVNKAELVIDVVAGTDVNPFAAAPRLALYRYDIAERRQNVPDNDVPSRTNPGDPRALPEIFFGGYYDSINKRYIFNITSYMQDLLDGKIEDYGTFIAPTPVTEFNLFPSLSVGARTVIGAFNNPNHKIKLKLYYTKIN